MFKRPLSLAIVAISVPLFGGVAYAATQSVSNTPNPQVVIPTTPTTDDHGGARTSTTGRDDSATHDANDDKGGLTTTVTVGDDPATHDVGDDHGGTTVTTSDDHGGTTAPTGDDPATHDATHDVGDDHGSSSSSGGGKDDPATHDVGDDHGGR
jgi:hypothetical protein